MTTLNDIAKEVGVAKSTVSRALRDDPTLSLTESTRKKIFETADRLGYKINKNKSLAFPKTIAIIHKDSHFLNQLDNGYYFSLRYSIEKTCLSEHVECRFYPESFLEQIAVAQLNGAILMGNFAKDRLEKIYAHLQKKVPCVFIGKFNCLQDEIDWITHDTKRCVDLAIAYFCEKKLYRILYVGGRDVAGTPADYNKLFHFKRCLDEHPELTCVDVIEGEHGTESGYRMTLNWFKNHDSSSVDAIFVSNDPIAFGSLRALNEMGISVPGNISVLGVNGDGPGAETTPPLSTVDIHTMRMGEEAVHCLIDRMNRRHDIPKKVMFSPTLVLRNSTR